MLAAEQLKDMHGREKDLVGLDAEGLHVHSCTHASERHATRSRVLAHRGHGVTNLTNQRCKVRFFYHKNNKILELHL